MILERYTQSTTERIRYGIDYSAMLENGETIFNPEFSVTPNTSPQLVCGGPSIITGNALIWYVSGGVSNTKYTVKVKVTSSLGIVREDEILYTME